MTRVLRHSLAVVALPTVMTVVIPLLIWRAEGSVVQAPSSWVAWCLVGAGAAALLLGGVLFVASLTRFDREGHGTLAPWDPPTELVIHGPYAYVRNPMITGVCFVLFGEALILRSSSHALWAAGFTIFNALYIALVEEPLLRARFGEAYVTYAARVPRLFPTFRKKQGG